MDKKVEKRLQESHDKLETTDTDQYFEDVVRDTADIQQLQAPPGAGLGPYFADPIPKVNSNKKS